MFNNTGLSVAKTRFEFELAMSFVLFVNLHLRFVFISGPRCERNCNDAFCEDSAIGSTE